MCKEVYRTGLHVRARACARKCVRVDAHGRRLVCSRVCVGVCTRVCACVCVCVCILLYMYCNSLVCLLYVLSALYCIMYDVECILYTI